MDKKRYYWNEDLIESEILKVIDVLRMNRMPTRKEIENIVHNSSLTNKISKTLGFKGWAEKLSLETKNSCSSKGWQYEEQSLIDLKLYTDLMGVLTPIKSPYDVKVGNTRIDIKMSNKFFSETQNFYCYSFSINDSNCGSDFYIFYCVSDETIEKTYIIPSVILKDLKQFTIGCNKTKYDKFLNRWNLIKDFNNMVEEWSKNL